jgi:hypothetical protein
MRRQDQSCRGTIQEAKALRILRHPNVGDLQINNPEADHRQWAPRLSLPQSWTVSRMGTGSAFRFATDSPWPHPPIRCKNGTKYGLALLVSVIPVERECGALQT